MNSLPPKYTKVLTLGSSRTDEALIGKVIIQEKIDGSQFRFGLSGNGDIVAGSHRRNFGIILEGEEHDGMFLNALKSIERMRLELLRITPETYFFAEYLSKPKHNALCYERTPKNNLVLFDVLQRGKWLDRDALSGYAEILDIELIPELYRGESNIDMIKDLVGSTKSCLGGVNVEGAVIKNYEKNIELGGNIFPLFTKYVCDKFKELHGANPMVGRKQTTLEDFFKQFSAEARWVKAVNALKEHGVLTNSVRDIGPIINSVIADIKEECADDIKEFLYNRYIRDIARTATINIPNWYKEKLLENLK